MKYVNKKIQISCDGGGATGKSTGAKMIAKKYKLKFLSSGLLYRYAAFLLLKHKPKNQIIFLKRKFKKLNYKKLEKINLHTPKISKKIPNNLDWLIQVEGHTDDVPMGKKLKYSNNWELSVARATNVGV